MVMFSIDGEENSQNKKHLMTFKVKTFDEAQAVARKIVSEFSLAECVYIGLNELIINAIEHGNLEIDFKTKTRFIADGAWLDEVNYRLTLPEYKQRTVDIELEENKLHYLITIKDQGAGFDWLEYTDSFSQPSLSKHGRGIIIAQLISFDKVEYFGKGNCVRCYIKK